MHRVLLLHLAYLAGTAAIVCPFGFTDDNNGNCQSEKLGPSSQINAYTNCANSGAYLINVINAFSNKDVTSMAGAFDKIWLGLTCTSSDLTSCFWDNGQNVTVNTYTNFYPGHPNADVGACVYLATSTGQWFSTSCSQTQAVFVCRYTPGIKVPLCPGYSYFFRGLCYFSVYALGYSDAATKCSDNCGQLASIHNLGENSFVRDIVYSNATTANYGIIGLSYTNEQTIIWSDYTSLDYTNYGLNTQALGNCFFIAMSNDIVQKGQWISTDCTYNSPAVCKKELTCDVATQSPLLCSGNKIIQGSGELLSPGYPRESVTNLCEYTFLQNQGFIATITFPEISLDRNSSIKLYSSILDTTPFAVITNIAQASNVTYYSGSNLLKMIYEVYDNTYFKNLWRAEYGTLATLGANCGGNYRKPGRAYAEL